MMRAEEELPDGSTCTVSLADGGCRSIISRVLPDGRCGGGAMSEGIRLARQYQRVVETGDCAGVEVPDEYRYLCR